MSEIKLESGQRVRLRNGEVHSVEDLPGGCSYPFRINYQSYTSDGFFHADRRNHPLDVVEILPPEPAPVPTIELGKWYPCRDAQWRCKVLETGLPGLYAWAGIRRNINKENGWLLESWTAKGHCMNDAVESRFDLMLAPPEPKRYTVTRWVNCYAENGKVILSTLYETRTRADGCASRDRIACVPCTIEFTEGEGLS